MFPLNRTNFRVNKIVPRLYANTFTDLKKKNLSLDEIKNSVFYNINFDNIVELTNIDFETGTYRITKPGIYVLKEDIIFSPNKDNKGRPTTEQITTLPQSFVLGFFAAITIECSNVILNLNKHSIKQSEIFSVQQPFYSHIELANSPFVFNQGPATFGDKLCAGKNVVIKNGTLGLSSHHGIHGNLCENVIIHDLKIENFFVASIAINGGKNIYVKDINVNNKNISVKFNSLLSQGIFLLPLLEKLSKKIPYNNTKIGNKNNRPILLYEKLFMEIKTAFDSVLNNKEYTGIFNNVSRKYDANMYGMVFNSAGIVVNAFKTMRDNNTKGNQHIVLENITMSNLESDGTEVKVLCDDKLSKTKDTTGYSGDGILRGAFGSVVNFDVCIENDKYKSNIITDSQLMLAIYDDIVKNKNNIPEYFYTWANMTNKTLTELIKDYKLKIINGRDSMAHVMKGNIGLFISQGEDFIIDNVSISNVINNSVSLNDDAASSNGILFTGSRNINLQNYKISNIKSHRNIIKDIELKTFNSNIHF